MEILYSTTNNSILYVAPRFEYGIFDEPDVQKWGIYDADGNLQHLFFMDANYATATINEEDIPEDFQLMDSKYLFVDGEFVRNPDWQPPEEPVEVRLNRLEEAMAELAEMMFGGEL